MVTSLMVPPQGPPVPTLLCDDPSFLECAVSIDCDCICSVSSLPLADGIAVLYNPTAMFLGLPSNRRFLDRLLAGTVYIAAHTGEHLIDLSDAQITEYVLRYWYPEIHCEEEVLDSYLDSLLGLDKP